MAEVFRRGGKGKYLGSFVDEHGKQRTRSTGCSDKRAAEGILRKWETDAAQRRAGLIDPAAEKFRNEAAKPFEEHVMAYGRHLAVGSTAKHVDWTLKVLRAVAAHAEIDTLAGLTADVVNAYAADLASRTSRRRLGQPVASKTVHAHVAAAKGLSAWLVRGGKLPRNPLVGVQSPSPKRRTRRRMLQTTELPWLEAATRGGGVFRRLTGEERWLLYWTAISTGFRANELRSLQRSDLRPRDGKAVLFLNGRFTKNREEAWIDIEDDLEAALRASLASDPRRRNLLKTCNETEESRLLAHDLAAARAAWLAESPDDERAERDASDFLLRDNAAGEHLDFHSLRHTFGAWQVIDGQPLPVVQRRMRHKTMAMTTDTYGHLAPGQEVQASAALAGVLSRSRAVHAQYLLRETSLEAAKRCEAAADAGRGATSVKGLDSRGFCGVLRENAAPSETGRRTDEHPDQRDSSQRKDGENAFETQVPPPSAVHAQYLDAAHAKLTALWPSLTAETKAALLFLAEGAARPQTPQPSQAETAPGLPTAEPALRPNPRGKGVRK